MFNKMCSTYHLTSNYTHVNSFNISAFAGVICKIFYYCMDMNNCKTGLLGLEG